MRTLFLSLLLAGCAGPAQNAAPTVSGDVTSVDLDPWAYDGSARIEVRTDDGATAVVGVPARINLCAAEGLGEAGQLRVGDRVEVRGERAPEGVVTPCTSADHYLRRLPRAE